MYAYSCDNEIYHGRFQTVDDAIAQAVANGCVAFWVGTITPPTPPEDCFHADYWIDVVCSDDDYTYDVAEDWPQGITQEQRRELESEVRTVIACWLERHNLRPTFFLVPDAVEYLVVDGNAVRRADS